jgi:hypothetical protein
MPMSPMQDMTMMMSWTSGSSGEAWLRLEAVVAPNGEDLSEVMPGVDEVEPAPLVDGERAENLVTDGAAASENGLCLVRELVDTG